MAGGCCCCPRPVGRAPSWSVSICARSPPKKEGQPLGVISPGCGLRREANMTHTRWQAAMLGTRSLVPPFPFCPPWAPHFSSSPCFRRREPYPCFFRPSFFWLPCAPVLCSRPPPPPPFPLVRWPRDPLFDRCAPHGSSSLLSSHFAPLSFPLRSCHLERPL